MPARSPTTRETWADVTPDDAPTPELLSHDELLERLRERGIDLKSSALQYYRHRGILPRPIRRRHGGITQAVYPHWYVRLIELLRNWQADGMSLDEIRDRLPPIIEALALRSTPPWRDLDREAAIVALDAILHNYGRVMEPRIAERGATAGIANIRVVLLDDEGNELDSHTVPYEPDDHYVPNSPGWPLVD